MISPLRSLRRPPRAAAPLLLVLVPLAGCTREPTDSATPRQDEAPGLTNRLQVPPEVVGNLGITYETATRGRLGVWRQVPGQLEVPEQARWRPRAPARCRVVSTVSRWQEVAAGEVLATLTSPELLHAQNRIEIAHQQLARAHAGLLAAKARLTDSTSHVEAATQFEQASHQRLAELQRLHDQGNALTEGELLTVRAAVTDAGRARLDAALRRDELAAAVADWEIEAERARQAVQEELQELAVLTGLEASLLEAGDDAGAPRWRGLRRFDVLAPAAGTVSEVFVTAGDLLAAGDDLLVVLDTRELRFRGHLPEGDLGSLDAGDPVRIEFPSHALPPVETTLAPRIPVTDPATRMAHVEAPVPNPERRLADGLSALAWIRVEQSAGEEVLIPERCVVFDGLEAIVFKRASDDPNVAIRTPVELGQRARGLVEVFAGVLDGEQVVADGIHQLKQTGLGKPPEGGHFHADGTWHSDHK